jgi:hypothetical protein
VANTGPSGVGFFIAKFPTWVFDESAAFDLLKDADDLFLFES